MPALKVEIVRIEDDASYPGWVECQFTDAANVRHSIIEKIPVVTERDITSKSPFPMEVAIDCVVRDRSSTGSLIEVDLELPWGIESTSGLTQFVVAVNQVVPRIFVSCADISAREPQCLLESLQREGCAVCHSPRNPNSGPDPLWHAWYDHFLPCSLAHTDVFVAVIDEAWDSSTWMAEEARQALEVNRILLAFYWNPRSLPIRALHQYVHSRLPEDVNEAARILRASVPDVAA